MIILLLVIIILLMVPGFRQIIGALIWIVIALMAIGHYSSDSQTASTPQPEQQQHQTE